MRTQHYFLKILLLATILATSLIAGQTQAMDLSLARSAAFCGQSQVSQIDIPAAAHKRISQSSVARGTQNISSAWLGSPTIRYPHKSLGAYSHAASLHVLVRGTNAGMIQLDYELPIHRVFEDLMPRLIDLDGDGSDEIVLVESDNTQGAAVVVLGIDKQGGPANLRIKELARSANIGMPFRWLNPVGVADFDRDGKLDLAAILTPHLGGVLTLYRYEPPNLTPFAKLTDVSNHRMGSSEQRLAVIVPPSKTGQAPTVIVPDMTLKALYALRWAADTAQPKWQEIASVKALPAGITLMLPLANGACAQLADGSWWQVGLMH
jgi:hypothetical protein